jgi:uncharacterized protein YabN with tetrapyrrole methylase and pyrophosphatase domain
MPLLVVPLAPDEATDLTLGEWDAVLRRDPVVFERRDHPLAARLKVAGRRVAFLDDDPAALSEGAALVADPTSPRIVDLAGRGAVLIGPGSEIDPLTAAWASPIARRAGKAAASLAAIMARLRSVDGCLWDLEQTHVSLKPHLIEEAYEVIDAIENDRIDEELEEELGDLLLQVIFHAQLAADDGRFDLEGVARRITAKLLHRHPHVFSDAVVTDAQQVVSNWEVIKSQEKGRADPFDDIPVSLPALTKTFKTQKRAASLGFNPGADEAAGRTKSALDAEELGEALFWIVALARARGIDPEGALRRATASFRAGLGSEGAEKHSE